MIVRIQYKDPDAINESLSDFIGSGKTREQRAAMLAEYTELVYASGLSEYIVLEVDTTTQTVRLVPRDEQ